MKKIQKELLKKEENLEKEIRDMENVEYGIKELIHGILIGIIVGFVIAWFLLK
jgi:F0F1-type ATP synthase assembly protein I